MAAPLPLSYNWRAPLVFATVGLVACLGILARGQAVGWLSAATVLVLCWAAYCCVVWLRTRSYLLVEGPVLTTRRWREFERVEAAELRAVKEVVDPGRTLVPAGGGAGGERERVTVPTALLLRGPSTLFTWILAQAPHADLGPKVSSYARTAADPGVGRMTTPPLPPDEPVAPDTAEPGSPTDQETSMPDHLALDHPTMDDLADLAVGELPDDAAAAAEQHLAGCASCRAELAELSAELDLLSGDLAALPPVAMPVTVAARLDRVLTSETSTVTPFRRPAPLKAGATATYVKQTGVIRLDAGGRGGRRRGRLRRLRAERLGRTQRALGRLAGPGPPGGPGQPGQGPGQGPRPRPAPVLGRLALRSRGHHAAGSPASPRSTSPASRTTSSTPGRTGGRTRRW